MGELAERVEDGKLRIGRGEEREGEGDGSTDDRVTVVKLGQCEIGEGGGSGIINDSDKFGNKQLLLGVFCKSAVISLNTLFSPS